MYRAEGLFLSKMNVFISITKRSKRVNLVLVQHLSAVIWRNRREWLSKGDGKKEFYHVSKETARRWRVSTVLISLEMFNGPSTVKHLYHEDIQTSWEICPEKVVFKKNYSVFIAFDIAWSRRAHKSKACVFRERCERARFC